MPRVLTLDAALALYSVGVVVDGVVLAERVSDQVTCLPGLAAALLEGQAPDLIAVTIGPGSFTGLRSALALAHGIAIATGVDAVGVTLGAAFGHLAPADRQLWTTIDSKRGRIFLEREGEVHSLALADLPRPAGPVAVAGDAAIAVAARLAARDADVQLLAARRAEPLGIALAALRGDTRPPLPLYVDPPAARPGPAGRPAPA